MKTIDLIVPCYNEEEGLEHFVLETNKVIDSMPEYSFRYILVNDGSKDKTYLVMKKLAKQFSNVKYISFSRNFGKEAAMYAGLQHSTRRLCGGYGRRFAASADTFPTNGRRSRKRGLRCLRHKA